MLEPSYKLHLSLSFFTENQFFHTEPSNLGADAAQQLTGDKYKASEPNPYFWRMILSQQQMLSSMFESISL